MYSIAICDDDRAMGELLEAHLDNYFGQGAYAPRFFEDAKGLKTAVKAGYRPDIAIIDIVLGMDSGIEMVRELFPLPQGPR